jgi:repressor LexA
VGKIAAGARRSPRIEGDNGPLSPCRRPCWARASTIMLEIEGDSMIEAGILDGDLVVIKKSDTGT